MTRWLFVALLAIPWLAGAAQAQPRPMPAYQDDESYAPPSASDDNASSRDARGEAGYPRNYGDPSIKQRDRQQDPYAGYNDVPPPAGEDAAHRADRLRTADLNHRANARPTTGSGSQSDNGYARQSAQYRAELADHARALQDYGDERARYADRVARWRARANACEAGNVDACGGAE